MRTGVLALAFDHLGAVAAVSSATLDNAPSLAVSRRLGYADNGLSRTNSQAGVIELQHLRLLAETWRTAGHRVEIEGVAACPQFFGLSGQWERSRSQRAGSAWTKRIRRFAVRRRRRPRPRRKSGRRPSRRCRRRPGPRPDPRPGTRCRGPGWPRASRCFASSGSSRKVRARWACPQEHLEHEEVDVERCDQSGEDVGDDVHARSVTSRGRPFGVLRFSGCDWLPHRPLLRGSRRLNKKIFSSRATATPTRASAPPAYAIVGGPSPRNSQPSGWSAAERGRS